MQLRFDTYSKPVAKQFVDHLRRLVMEEAATARYRDERLWSNPIAARIAEGHAIIGDRIQRIDRKHSRFCEGDMLCLNRGSSILK